MKTPEQERERKRVARAKWRAENPERHRAELAAWRAKNREHMATYSARRWREDLEGNRELDRVRRARYADRKRATLAQWKRDNRGRMAELQARRRARQRGNDWEPVDRAAIFERDGGICYLCRLPVDPLRWHLDHVVPLSKGGPHVAVNVAVSHPFCNLSKHDREPSEVASA